MGFILSLSYRRTFIISGEISFNIFYNLTSISFTIFQLDAECFLNDTQLHISKTPLNAALQST